MKSLIAEPRQNIDKNAIRNIWKEKKEGQKKREKNKENQESCHRTSLKFHLNF